MQLAKTDTSMIQAALSVLPTDNTLLTLTFRIGNQQYGMPVSVVIEIVRLPALVSLAGAPPEVIGLLNLRGRYFPVLDGSILVGETPTYDITNQIIIVGRIDETNLEPLMGLRVDQVIDVRTLSIRHVTPLNKRIAADFLQGVVKANDDSLLLLEPESLLKLVPETPSDLATLPTEMGQL
jgi:purine-binding chemotaxis protein CheW